LIVREISRTERRAGVILNYLGVGLIALVVDMRGSLGWGTTPVIIVVCAATVLGLVTFIRVFWRTHLWKMTHAGFTHLDERQVQVVYESLRNSYSIFAIVCLAILYINAVIAKGHIPILVAAAVLYVAHTLPAAVVAWTEKEILTGE
jgi:hypothetical protein